MRILRQQLREILTRPNWAEIRKDVATAGAFGLSAGLVCQQIERSHKSRDGGCDEGGGMAAPAEMIVFDWRRFGSVGLFEAMYMGGCFHVLCQTFPRLVQFSGRRLARLSQPGAAPQSFLTPMALALQSETSGVFAFGCSVADTVHDGLVMIPAYFFAVGMLPGDSYEQARENLRREWLNSYLVGAGFWMPVMYANFKYAGKEWRMRTMALANCVWSILIDYMAHRGTQRLTGASSTGRHPAAAS